MSEEKSQAKSKKVILGIIFGTLAIIFGLLVLLPAFVNTDEIRTRIEETASKAIGGKIYFEKISVDIFPLPQLSISRGRIAISDSVQGKWAELSVFPRIPALLFGRLEVADVKLKKPEFELTLPMLFQHKPADKESGTKGGAFRQQIKEELQALNAVVKDVEVTIDGGYLKVFTNDKPPMEWRDITTSLTVDGKQAAVELTCSSSFIQKIILNSELDLSTLNMNGTVFLGALEPRSIMTYLKPESDLKIIDGSVDLTLAFQSEDWSNWRGDFENRVSLFKVQNNSHQEEIGPALMKGAFDLSPSKMEFTIDRLDLEKPKMSLTGKLLVDSSEEIGVHFQAIGHNIDVQSIRDTTLSLGGHIPNIRKVFTLVKGGRVPTIKTEVKGKDWTDLKDFKRWHIEGDVVAGAIFIPKVNLDLTEIYGHAKVENGILTADNIRADYKKTHGRQGFLKIGLVGDAKPFHLDLDLNADLAQLPPILYRTIDHKQFRAELSRIDQLSGTGVGKLILGESLDEISVQVDVSRFNLNTRFNRLPHPLTVKGGQFQLKDHEIRLTDLRLKMKETHFSKISAQVNWEDSIAVKVSAGNGRAGPDFAQWFEQEIKVPDQYHLKLPVNFKNLDVEWDQSNLSGQFGKISVAGSMTTSTGSVVTADIKYSPVKIDIQKLTVHDDASNAELVLSHKFKEKITDLFFKGHLSKNTLDQFLKNNQCLEGVIKGKLTARIDSAHPWNSVVTGNMEADKVIMPFTEADPIRINHTLLSASKRKLTIHDADIDWLESRFKLDGHMSFLSDSILLEINTAAEEIDVARLKALFKEDAKEGDKKTGKDEEAWPLIAFRGIVHIDAEQLKYGVHTLAPYRAALMLEENSITMNINEAKLCDISTPGTVKFSEQGVWIKVTPSSQPEDIQLTSGCLRGKSTSEILEGQFQTSGAINTQGKTRDELLRNLKGNIEIIIKDGHVYNTGKVGTLTNILSYLRINRVLKGDVPDMESHDFPYKLLSAKFYFQDGKLIFTEAHINGKALNIVATEGELDLFAHTMDFKVLVSPFTTVDTTVNRIPLIGSIFQGTLIAIPVNVKGDISNPKVRPLSPSAFGSHAMGILKRTLQAPVKIIKPVVPDTIYPQNKDSYEP